MACVFRLKTVQTRLPRLKKELPREIFHDGIFGKWAIEYQKRRLSHLHLLVFLEDFLESSTGWCVWSYGTTSILV
jgi:hypothetical protein